MKRREPPPHPGPAFHYTDSFFGEPGRLPPPRRRRPWNGWISRALSALFPWVFYAAFIAGLGLLAALASGLWG